MGTYAKSEAAGTLRQGEILTNFTQYQLDIEQLRLQNVVAIPILHAYVIVLSQDCDLDQDYRRRAQGKQDNLLGSIIFCAAAPADKDFREDIGLDSKEWKRFKQNQDPRLHYLREVPTADDAGGEGLPELAIDFRQYFALPTAEAYLAIETARRRCRLEQPYTEHLSNRFSWHLSRVALPLDHHLPLPAEAETPLPAAEPAFLGDGPAAPSGNAPAVVNGDGAAAAAAPAQSVADGPANVGAAEQGVQEAAPPAAPEGGGGPQPPG